MNLKKVDKLIARQVIVNPDIDFNEPRLDCNFQTAVDFSLTLAYDEEKLLQDKGIVSNPSLIKHAGGEMILVR